jgi:hypothetical protein
MLQNTRSEAGQSLCRWRPAPPSTDGARRMRWSGRLMEPQADDR